MPLVFSTSSVDTLWLSSCWEWFLHWGFFRIRGVFSFVIHSGMSVSCKYLVISIVNLSAKEVNFLHQYPCMPLWPGVLQFNIFLVFLWMNWIDFSPSVLLHFSYFSYPFGFSVMFYLFLYFAPKLFCSLSSGCWYIFVHSSLRFFFSLFWNILFGMYYFILSRYLFCLPSFASNFWFISSSCFTCVAFSFCFFPMLQRSPSVLSFSIFVVDLFAFPIEFLIQILSFCSCSLGEHQLSLWLLSLLHRLVILWCRSWYVLMIRLFFRFLTVFYSLFLSDRNLNSFSNLILTAGK